MEMLLKTYQYAANSLGNFILDLKNKGWLKNTIVAATGDHNARMRYQSEGNWHHVFGVPVLFWLPDQQVKSSANSDRWVSHRDIVPTLLAMATGKILGNEKGRNEDKLVKAERCSNEQETMGKEARAQRAISEFIVRKGLNE